MLLDLHQALKEPQAAIRAIVAEGSVDGYEQRVCTSFSELFKGASSLEQIERLTSITKYGSLPPKGSLVRFRAMVQDTGFSTEVYPAINAQGDPLAFGLDEMENHTLDIDSDSFKNLKERQSLCIVSVPAETRWTKAKRDSTSDDAMLQKLNIADDKQPKALATRYAIPDEAHFVCIAKVYADMTDKLKIGEVAEFVGILGETTQATAYEHLTDSDATSAEPVPAIHVLFTRPPADLSLPDVQDAAAVRAALVSFLASSLAGDQEAAEWLLMSLLSKIHTRTTTGTAVGSMSLNLAFKTGADTDLASKLRSVLTNLLAFDLSIAKLNDPKFQMAPASRNEQLDSGLLQVPDGTNVLVDLRGMGEGELKDHGISNLRALSTAIAQHKLVYQFPYTPFELPVDLNFVLLSEGKAIVPTDCLVYVHSSETMADSQQPSTEQLEQFRAFLLNQKQATFTIAPEMAEVIQSDYVERRQKSVGGEGMTSDDLIFRMTAARLYALSLGKTSMDKDIWMRVSEMDERRKDRFPRKAVKTAAAV